MKRRILYDGFAEHRLGALGPKTAKQVGIKKVNYQKVQNAELIFSVRGRLVQVVRPDDLFEFRACYPSATILHGLPRLEKFLDENLISEAAAIVDELRPFNRWQQTNF